MVLGTSLTMACHLLFVWRDLAVLRCLVGFWGMMGEPLCLVLILDSVGVRARCVLRRMGEVSETQEQRGEICGRGRVSTDRGGHSYIQSRRYTTA